MQNFGFKYAIKQLLGLVSPKITKVSEPQVCVIYLRCTRMLLVSTRMFFIYTRILIVLYSYYTRIILVLYSYYTRIISCVTRMYSCGVLVTISVGSGHITQCAAAQGSCFRVLATTVIRDVVAKNSPKRRYLQPRRLTMDDRSFIVRKVTCVHYHQEKYSSHWSIYRKAHNRAIVVFLP